MEPRIQYAKTSDGVSIAYYTAGTGEPLLVLAPVGPSHLTLERRLGTVTDWYQHLAGQRTIIRFDQRNSGMSERKVEDIAIETFDLDAMSVLQQLGIERVDVVAVGPSTLTAIGLASRQPGIVRKLVLVNPVLRWMDFFLGPQGKAILSLAGTDWNLFVETASHARLGWSRQESHDFAVLWRESVSRDDYLRLIPILRALDVTPLLPDIRAETLVLYNAAGTWARTYMKAAREIGSNVRGAEVIESDDGAASWLQSRKILRGIDDFLGISSEPVADKSSTLPSGTAIILFADIVDSTALTERLGDTAFRDKARDLDASLRAIIQQANGTTIEGKLLGDGVLSVFTSARDAITAALHFRDASRAIGLELHLGLHAGDVIRESGNVYGGAVNIAARISGLSAPGEVLVSDTVRSLARTSADVHFKDRGEHALKGIADPIRAWAVVPSA